MKSPSIPPRSPDDCYPAAVVADVSADEVRRRRLAEITRVTLIGILVRLGVILVEGVGVWYAGSAALFVDVVASFFDVVASLVLLAAVQFAARPPDEEHPFGHGRTEPLAGFQLAILLIATGAWLGGSNLFAITSPSGEHHVPGWTWLIPAGATVALLLVTWLVRQTGRRTRSSALEAEAVHFQIDALTSLMTALTLLAAAFFPQNSGLLDYLGGCFLAVIMILLGIHAANGNLHQLLDRVPPHAEMNRVRTSALAVAGVFDVEKVRIQQAGPDAHVNIDIEVEPEISVAEGHRIAQQVRAQIQTDWPFVRDVVVHVEPYYAGDH